MTGSGRVLVVAAALAAAWACGSEDGGGPSPAPLAIAKPSAGSGDQQVGIVGRPLPEELRVVVTEGGLPAEGVEVTWSTIEGSITPITAITDADGVSRARWTLQELFAQQFSSASITAPAGTATVGFTAMAGPDPDAWNTVLVLSDGNRFDPAEITIAAGDTVNWYWPPGSTGHNIVPDDGDLPPHSGAPDAYPRSHTFRFGTAGVYRYHCAVHGGPGGVGMAGTITVVPPETTQSTRGR